MNKIVGLGEILWDLLPSGKKLGGAPANFAYHVTQMGFEGIVASSIGNDELGQEIIDNLSDKHMQTCIAKTPYPTGTVKVKLDKNGVPQYEITENVAWDHIEFSTQLEFLSKQTQAVCFGSLAQRNSVSRETIIKFLNNIPNDSKHLKIFDINLRQSFYNKEVIEDSLLICNILKINDEEIICIGKLLGYTENDMSNIAKRILVDYDINMVILSCGAIGSYAFSKTESSYISTPKVIVADTVGAGDSFTAAFCASLLKGKTMKESHQYAVNVSAFVCTQNGAMPKLPKELI